MVFTTGSDIVQLCKEELCDKIEYLESLVQKSSLLPSDVPVKEPENAKQPIYTSCDLGNSKEEAIQNRMNPRARQNVVFEHGYMCAVLNRRNVCALVEGGVEIPGDISGIVYISYDENGAWQLSVAKEMKSAGLDVDLNRLI